MQPETLTNATLSTEHFTPDGSDLAAVFGITLAPIASTKCCVAHLGSDGIVYFRYRPGAEEDVKDFVEYHKQVESGLRGKGKSGILVDLTNLVRFTNETRRAHASAEALEPFYALALIVRSPLARAIGGLLIILDRPPIPTHLFATEAEAREWLLHEKTHLNGHANA